MDFSPYRQSVLCSRNGKRVGTDRTIRNHSYNGMNGLFIRIDPPPYVPFLEHRIDCLYILCSRNGFNIILGEYLGNLLLFWWVILLN